MLAPDPNKNQTANIVPRTPAPFVNRATLRNFSSWPRHCFGCSGIFSIRANCKSIQRGSIPNTYSYLRSPVNKFPKDLQDRTTKWASTNWAVKLSNIYFSHDHVYFTANSIQSHNHFTAIFQRLIFGSQFDLRPTRSHTCIHKLFKGEVGKFCLKIELSSPLCI